MKAPAVFSLLLLISVQGFAQNAADTTRSGFRKTLDLVGAQLSERCVFEPECIDFLPQAVRELGPVRGIAATADRLTRCSRIGTSGHNMAASDGRIHEGVEAYRPAPRRLPKQDAAPLPAAPKSASSERSRYASSEMGFVDYLIGQSLASDACTLLSQDIYFPSDTLDYLRGWANYSAQNLKEASASFDLVPKDSPFYDKSLFFSAISNAHEGRYDRAASLLDSYAGSRSELCSFERAGIALLQGDRYEYTKAAANFTYNDFALSSSERALKEISTERFLKSKNPIIAAAASAVVPGLGKIYAGELGEGLSSMLVVGSLAAITAENWAHHGPTNWKTLLFGSLGTIFYIGNIYGSYFSVSIHDNWTRDAQDTAILYNIHIPLRSTFN